MQVTSQASEAAHEPAAGQGFAQVLRAAGIVMVLFIASRAAGLVREMAISARFGTSAELDAYLAAFRLPDIIFQLAAGGALGSAFLPVFTQRLVRGDKDDAWRLASAVTNLVLTITTIMAAIAAFFAPLLVERVIAPGFTPAQQALTAHLMRWMLISSVIFGVSGIVMGILNAHQHFVLPAAAPVAYNVCIILGAWVLAPRWGVFGLVIGVVTGAAFHLAVQVPGLVRFGVRYIPTLGLSDPGVREVGRLMAPRVLGLAAVQINFLVNTILASKMPAGSLSALNYAWLLMLLPQGIIAQAVATAAFPTFAEKEALGQRGELAAILSSTMRAILALSVPAAVGLIALRVPLIRLLLERGAFDERSTQAVAFALTFFAVGLVAHSLLEVISRAFYALHDTWTPVAVGIAAMALNVMLSLLLMGPLRHGGLALANTLATTVEMAVLIGLLRRRLGELRLSPLADTLGRSGLASLVMGAAILWWLSSVGRGAPWWSAASGMVVGGLIYLGCFVIISRRDAALLWRQIVKR